MDDIATQEHDEASTPSQEVGVGSQNSRAYMVPCGKCQQYSTVGEYSQPYSIETSPRHSFSSTSILLLLLCLGSYWLHTVHLDSFPFSSPTSFTHGVAFLASFRALSPIQSHSRGCRLNSVQQIRESTVLISPPSPPPPLPYCSVAPLVSPHTSHATPHCLAVGSYPSPAKLFSLARTDVLLPPQVQLVRRDHHSRLVFS